jgi:hypothetical protein
VQLHKWPHCSSYINDRTGQVSGRGESGPPPAVICHRGDGDGALLRVVALFKMEMSLAGDRGRGSLSRKWSGKRLYVGQQQLQHKTHGNLPVEATTEENAAGSKMGTAEDNMIQE